MRAFLTTFALLLALAVAGLAALSGLPDPAAPLTARTGPALKDAKTWGYQLQRVIAVQIPATIDVLVVDFTARHDVAALRTKPDGTKRIVLCYLSIGEAENYRDYWQRRWAMSPPAWLGPENPSWKGNFTVNFWYPEWQRLIVEPDRASLTFPGRVMLALFPQPRPYLDQILEAGFDGVYLDRVDAYEKPLEIRPSSKRDMIAFVETISAYAKKRRPGFLVIPQNGEALLTEPRYRRAIDGIGKEDLMFGEPGDGLPNIADEVRTTVGYLNRAKADGYPVFVVEYLADEDQKRKAHSELRQLGFVATFTERGLNVPPALPPEPSPAPAPAPVVPAK
ncbi:MAG: endo alpha-1,4 polygalactosaminidase [Hyphomicrobiaceae bacterium]